ncbi:MAG: hypothetical protein JW795_21330 [Chitinivibrionales bacterium]|nr:hypothetical protein [Chitinivibrionales bacterium]
MNKQWKFFKEDIKKFLRVNFKKEKVNFFALIGIFFLSHSLHCVAVYRLGQFAHELKSASILLAFPFIFIFNILDFFVKAIYHISIVSPIGPGLYIGHIGPLYIGAKSIGSNLSVTHNVTIGKGNSKGKIGHPTIGDNVWIGTGSVITGEITIGNNVTIGPGSILNIDIDAGYFVSGNPARPLIKDYPNSHLLGNIIKDINGISE